MADLFFEFGSFLGDVLLFELFSVFFSDLGSFVDDSEDSAHGFFEFQESIFAGVLQISLFLDDAVSKEYIFLSDTNIPQLMKILSAFDSKFISMPSPTIGNNFVLFGEGSDLSELSSERVDLVLFGKVEFEGIGKEREWFDKIEIGENGSGANVSYLSDHGFIGF